MKGKEEEKQDLRRNRAPKHSTECHQAIPHLGTCPPGHAKDKEVIAARCSKRQTVQMRLRRLVRLHHMSVCILTLYQYVLQVGSIMVMELSL